MKYHHSSDIALLFNELAILLESGVSLIEALRLMQVESDPALGSIIVQLTQAVESGEPLSGALAQQPQNFAAFLVKAVQNAEQNKQLVSTLYAIVAYLENDLNEHELTKQMGSSLIYVVFLLGISLAVTAVLLAYVVPVFADLYGNFGAELPFVTQVFIILGQYSLWILLAFTMLFGISFIMWYRIVFYLPLLGKLYYMTATSHFLHTCGFIVQQGNPLAVALADTGAAMHYNPRYSQALLVASQQVDSGKPVAEALKATGLFPQKVIHALYIGENRQHLGSLLQHLAEVYRLKVNHSFETRLRLLSFLLLMLTGSFIGTLVVAMYLPIFQIGVVM